MLDYHMHTIYSDDVSEEKGSTVSGLCEAAISRGIKEIAVTDHCEINEAFQNVDIDGIYRDILKAREKYGSKINVLFGIELGQAVHLPNEAKQITEKFPFDYIIGSVHAVRGLTDFHDLPLDKMQDSELLALWNKYISELEELAEWGHFCTLAHITYPFRYFKFAGREKLLDLENKGRELFEDVLRKIIQNGISLEVNTSGLRQGLGQTLPNDDIIRFYKELGGELITVGSDAHCARDVGCGIKETVEKLRAMGFKYITRYKNRKPYMEKI